MKLNPADSEPLYLQIVSGIKAECLNGRWRAGDRIPPVREMAAAFRINPNTVAKAYRQLQQEGVIEGRPGGGNFIAARDCAALELERTQWLDAELHALLQRAARLGFDKKDILHAILHDKS